MKKFLLCLAVVFAFALATAAQDTGAASSAGGGQTTAKTKKSTSSTGKMSTSANTTTGCIEKSGDGYVLKNSRYKEGVKVTGSDDLAPHVGHTVKLTGTWTTPKQEFAETKLDMVSTSCKMGGSASMSSGASKKKGTGTATPPPATPPSS